MYRASWTARSFVRLIPFQALIDGKVSTYVADYWQRRVPKEKTARYRNSGACHTDAWFSDERACHVPRGSSAFQVSTAKWSHLSILSKAKRREIHLNPGSPRSPVLNKYDHNQGRIQPGFSEGGGSALLDVEHIHTRGIWGHAPLQNFFY